MSDASFPDFSRKWRGLAISYTFASGFKLRCREKKRLGEQKMEWSRGSNTPLLRNWGTSYQDSGFPVRSGLIRDHCSGTLRGLVSWCDFWAVWLCGLSSFQLISPDGFSTLLQRLCEWQCSLSVHFKIIRDWLPLGSMSEITYNKPDTQLDF